MPPRGSEAYSQARGSLRDFRLDPRLAEEFSARQERGNADRLAQLAEEGQIAAAGIERMGDIVAEGARGAQSSYNQGKQRRMEQDAHEQRMKLSEEEQARANEVTPEYREKMRNLELQKAEESIKQMQAPKQKGNEAVAWSNTNQVDEQGRPIMFNRITGEYKSGAIKTRAKEEKVKEPRTQMVTYTDDQGNTVQEFVEAKPGQKFTGRPASKTAMEKTEKETKYRYDNLKSNAQKLRSLVSEHGTTEVTGSAGPEMDRLIYEMAIDYAKLVDPDSVAREGEVAAAQKYMLPVRNEMMGVKGAGIRNETALQAIGNYEKALDDRLKSRGLTPTETVVQDRPAAGTATASPDASGAEEKVVGGKRYRRVQGGWQVVP